MAGVIRILIVDDHLAVRVGLERLLRSEPGFVVAGVASGVETGIAQTQLSRPDVAVIDRQLQDGDGLALCRRLKAFPDPPRVLVYSAFADRQMTIPALLSGADGLVDKGAPADELFEAIRTVWRGGSAVPEPPRELLSDSAGVLPPDDLPILGLLLGRTPVDEVAAALSLDRSKLDARIDAMVRELTP